MSDHDEHSDPVDAAYVEAEAMLSDEAARAARRARVLAAVAREPAAAPVPAPRRPAWGRTGWLAAASVVGLGMLVTTLIRSPPSHQPSEVAPAAAVAPEAAMTAAARPALARPETQQAPALAAPRGEPPPTPTDTARAAPPPPLVPPPPLASEPRAFPAAPPPPPAVESEAKAAAPAADAAGRLASAAGEDALYRDRRASAPVPATALAQAERAAEPRRDQAERLRAAAAAGRTGEVETLLDQGASVDAPDADGDTALMKAVQAERSDTAALLRRRGASLDRRNHAGLSARDMARAKEDEALDQALGLGR